MSQQALMELLLRPETLSPALWGHPGQNWSSAPHVFMYNGSPAPVKVQILSQKVRGGA